MGGGGHVLVECNPVSKTSAPTFIIREVAKYSATFPLKCKGGVARGRGEEELPYKSHGDACCLAWGCKL